MSSVFSPSAVVNLSMLSSVRPSFGSTEASMRIGLVAERRKVLRKTLRIRSDQRRRGRRACRDGPAWAAKLSEVAADIGDRLSEPPPGRWRRSAVSLFADDAIEPRGGVGDLGRRQLETLATSLPTSSELAASALVNLRTSSTASEMSSELSETVCSSFCSGLVGARQDGARAWPADPASRSAWR